MARLYARTEAVRLHRLGDTPMRVVPSGELRDGSTATPARTPALREVVAELRAEEAAFAAPMPELDRKSRHFPSANLQRSRDPGGQARRSVNEQRT